MRTIRVTCDWCGVKGDCEGDVSYMPKDWELLYTSYGSLQHQRVLEICPKCQPARMRRNEVPPRKV